MAVRQQDGSDSKYSFYVRQKQNPVSEKARKKPQQAFFFRCYNFFLPTNVFMSNNFRWGLPLTNMKPKLAIFLRTKKGKLDFALGSAGTEFCSPTTKRRVYDYEAK